MRIIFLNTSVQGLTWFRQYYANRPELNADAAFDMMRRARQTISEFPFAARKFEGVAGVYEKKIPKTPFSILYTVRESTIFIIDIRDQRGFRSADAIDAFMEELRRKLKKDRN